MRATSRDIELLRFAAEQYAVSMPQLARLMGRSDYAARWLRARWQRAGWARGRVVLAGRPAFVWPTRRGVDVAGLGFKAVEPNPGRLSHLEAVVDVRLWLADRRPGAVWTCERDLAVGGAGEGHRPDALVSDEGQSVAVEVELSVKSRVRLEAIVAANLARYPAVWYFAAPAPARALAQLVDRFGSDRLHVLPLPGRDG